MQALPVGRAQLRREGGSGLAILAFGTMVTPGERLAEAFDATLVNMRFVKPLDVETIARIASRHTAIVTLEENAVAGGAGSAVAEALAADRQQLPLLIIGIPDRFIEHGSREECIALAGLDLPSLESAIARFWHRPGLARVTPATA
jgi:1-deoxy-D-xylulose-5-phosphate synthase